MMLAVSAMAGETYWLKIYQPVYFGGQELKSGEYRLDLDGDKAVLKSGKLSAESKVKLEVLGEKASATTLECEKVGEKLQISAIQLKGSAKKLVVQ
jgi:hypothetical protein